MPLPLALANLAATWGIELLTALLVLIPVMDAWRLMGVL